MTEYTKIKISCCNDNISFECAACGQEYILSVRNCEGILCCVCSQYMDNDYEELEILFENYKEGNEYYELTAIYNEERYISYFRGWLLLEEIKSRNLMEAMEG